MIRELYEKLVIGPIVPCDIHPVYPPPSGEKPQEDPMKFFLDSLLEFMVTQVDIQ